MDAQEDVPRPASEPVAVVQAELRERWVGESAHLVAAIVSERRGDGGLGYVRMAPNHGNDDSELLGAIEALERAIAKWRSA